MTDDPAETEEARAQRQAFYANLEQAQVRYRDLARQTQNPMYAWAALWSRGAVRENREMHGEPGGDLMIPAWCADYFYRVAVDLTGLAQGSDIRVEPTGEGWTHAVDPVTGHEMWTAPESTPLSPDEAMRLVSLALGFTRQGFNAFSAFRGTIDQMATFNRFEELRESGMSYSDALASLSQEKPANDPSVLRRRVTAGRRLVKGDRPEETDDTGKT